MAVIARLASHAFAPIFRHVPDHDVKECTWCMSTKRHRRQHVEEHIPLQYQKNVLTSTMITRFSMYINCDESTPSMLEMTKKFSRVNRLLTPDGMIPTKNTILQECKSMVSHMKINDHLLVYIQGEIDKDFFYGTADAQLLALSEMFGKIELPVSITVVTDSECDGNIFQLPLECEYNANSDLAIHKATDLSNRFPKVNFLHLPLKDTSNEFLTLLQKNRYRVSIFRILKAIPNSKVYSNHRFQSKLVNFTYG